MEAVVNTPLRHYHTIVRGSLVSFHLDHRFLEDRNYTTFHVSICWSSAKRWMVGAEQTLTTECIYVGTPSKVMAGKLEVTIISVGLANFCLSLKTETQGFV